MIYKYDVELDIQCNLKLKKNFEIKNNKTFQFNDDYLITIDFKCLVDYSMININIYSNYSAKTVAKYEYIFNYNGKHEYNLSLLNLCRTYRLRLKDKNIFFIRIKTSDLINEVKGLSYKKKFLKNLILATDFKDEFQFIDLCMYISYIKDDIEKSIEKIFINKSEYFGITNKFNSIDSVAYSKTYKLEEAKYKFYSMALLRLKHGTSIIRHSKFYETLESEYLNIVNSMLKNKKNTL